MAEKETLPLAALESLIREELSSGGSAVINIRGVSMLPLLKEGVTSVRIVPPTFPLKKYDIPFYKREDGQFVLHRVIGKRKDGYVCRGDHQAVKEFGVTEEMIIGVADTRIVHGKEKPLRTLAPRTVGGFLACTGACRFWARLFLGKVKRVLGGKK
jgi:hypothetical protein